MRETVREEGDGQGPCYKKKEINSGQSIHMDEHCPCVIKRQTTDIAIPIVMTNNNEHFSFRLLLRMLWRVCLPCCQ